MGQKTIALPEPVYNRLKAKKKPGENFPELIIRLLEQEEKNNKPEITRLFGILGENSNEWDEIEKDIYNNRLRAAKHGRHDGITFDDE